MRLKVFVLGVLGAVGLLLTVVAVVVLAGTFTLPMQGDVPSAAVEGTIIGPTHSVPLAGEAVWSQVEVRRNFTANDDGGSSTLLWRDVRGPERVQLETVDGVVLVAPGDPWTAWRYAERVSATYDSLADVPPSVLEGHLGVQTGDFLSVRVFALQRGDRVLVLEEDGHTERLWVGGRAAVEAETEGRRVALEQARVVLGFVVLLLGGVSVLLLATTVTVLWRARRYGE